MQDVRMMTKGKALVVVESGASFLKFSFYDASTSTPALIVRGHFTNCEAGAEFNVVDDQGHGLAHERMDPTEGPFDHSEAFKHLARWLQTEFGSRLTITAVGHRVTHGGMAFLEPALIDPEAQESLEELARLEPRHQPHNLAGIRAVSRLRPDLPQVACFDTAFHRGRWAVTERYGLPEEFFQRGVRRWGFHGLAYESVTAQFAKLAPLVAGGRVVTAHLGEETSICGTKGGRSIDVSSGFSILEGLPGAQSCGTIDPAIMLHLLQEMKPAEIETLLYERSGLLGVSSASGDIESLLSNRDPGAVAAVELYVYRAVREIGSMAAALGGLDALIFTSNVGETSPEIRGRICRGLSWLGLEIDARANERRESCISPTGRSPSVWVIPCDVHGIIAAHTLRLKFMATPRLIRRSGGGNNPACVG